MINALSTPRVPSKNDPPDPKATTGITYDNFSKTLEKLVRPDDGDRPQTAERYKYVMDTLYSSVRLRQWRISSSAAEPAFEIWDKKDSTRVLVTMKSVEIQRGLSMRQGEGIRKYRVADGLDAVSLFNAIKHAQEQIYNSLVVTGAAKPSNAPAWQQDGVEEPDEEFFKPLSVEERAEALDPVLDAEPDKSDPKQCAPSMNEAQIQKHLKSLQGRVLTIVDAILADKQQREAVKTLVNKEFRREMEKVGGYFLNPYGAAGDGE